MWVSDTSYPLDFSYWYVSALNGLNIFMYPNNASVYITATNTIIALDKLEVLKELTEVRVKYTNVRYRVNANMKKPICVIVNAPIYSN